jgi:hypothetical protein
MVETSGSDHPLDDIRGSGQRSPSHAALLPPAESLNQNAAEKEILIDPVLAKPL